MIEHPHLLRNKFLEWIGVKITHWTDNSVEMQLPVAEHFQNRSGAIQGGLLCTLLDSAAGYAVLAAPRHTPDQGKSVSLSLTVNFLEAANGDVLIVKGRVERRGRSIVFASSSVEIGGAVVATAVGTFKYSMLHSPAEDK